MPRTVALLSQGATLPVLGWEGLTGQRQVALGPQGGGVKRAWGTHLPRDLLHSSSMAALGCSGGRSTGEGASPPTCACGGYTLRGHAVARCN